MSAKARVGQCPICNQSFPVNLLNSHANKCLGDNGVPGNNTEEPEIVCMTMPSNETASNPRKRKSTDRQAWDNIFKRQQQTKKTKRENTTETKTLSDVECGVTASDILKSDEIESMAPGFKEVQERRESLQLLVKVNTKQKSAPLPELLRPLTLEEYVGQAQAVGPRSFLRSILKTDTIPSLMFWGPPGCGKTTLAKLIANHCKEQWNAKFVQLSAAAAGVADVKEVVKVAKNDRAMFKRKTILFLDEIHRFNKTQQDCLLPHVEDGTLVLLGATTENPSFYVNSALLSRSRVVVLEKLSCDNIEKILLRGAEKLGVAVLPVKNQQNGTLCPPVTMQREVITALANLCDGDARFALNSLEIAVQSCIGKMSEVGGEGQTVKGLENAVITVDDIRACLQRSHVLYDKTGDEHFNCMSALQKSIRGSDDSAALYWMARMLEGGEKPLVVARRLVRMASEDVGLGDPQALSVAVAAYQASHFIGMPECDVILAQCAVHLARAPKSAEVCLAYGKAKQCIRNQEGPLPGVPLHLRNASTKFMKDLGYGKGYKRNPYEDGSSEQDYFPEGLEGTNFFS